jgi:hypothetical protein
LAYQVYFYKTKKVNFNGAQREWVRRRIQYQNKQDERTFLKMGILASTVVANAFFAAAAQFQLLC